MQKDTEKLTKYLEEVLSEHSISKHEAEKHHRYYISKENSCLSNNEFVVKEDKYGISRFYREIA